MRQFNELRLGLDRVRVRVELAEGILSANLIVFKYGAFFRSTEMTLQDYKSNLNKTDDPVFLLEVRSN